MSKLKITPGPWRYGENSSSDKDGKMYSHTANIFCGHHRPEDGFIVATCEIRLSPDHTAYAEELVAKANANLIAAAPEMYVALSQLVDDEPCEYDHHGYCQTHNLGNPCEVALGRAALAKARGEKA